MAIGVDRVQLLKTESVSGGGDALDSAPFPMAPEEINPQEDAIESCGHYFQEATVRDEQVKIYRDASILFFCDASTGFAPQQLTGITAESLLVTNDGDTLIDVNGNIITVG